jgi:hypothetical protein
VVCFGLLMLIATPILRVAVSIVVFVVQRDWEFVAVTAFVLAVLLASFFLGKSGTVSPAHSALPFLANFKPPCSIALHFPPVPRLGPSRTRGPHAVPLRNAGRISSPARRRKLNHENMFLLLVMVRFV